MAREYLQQQIHRSSIIRSSMRALFIVVTVMQLLIVGKACLLLSNLMNDGQLPTMGMLQSSEDWLTIGLVLFIINSALLMTVISLTWNQADKLLKNEL